MSPQVTEEKESDLHENVGLIQHENSNAELIRRIREFASLLPIEKALEVKAIITNYEPRFNKGTAAKSRKIFDILLREDSQTIRGRIAQILKIATFNIHFETTDEMRFDILWAAAYPKISPEGENTDESLMNRRLNGRNLSGEEFDEDQRGVLPQEMIEDDADSTGRINLTDESEFERNSKKKPSDLATIEDVRLILNEFIQLGGSDLYIEPQGKTFRIRIMIDDKLIPIRENISKSRGEDIARCLIGLSGQSSAPMRHQNIDSAIRCTGKVKFETRDFEFRFHSHPTVHGTSCVIRSQSNLLKDFHQTGMERFQVNSLVKAGSERQGLVLITGATGSGKTVSLECLYHIHEQKGFLKIIEIVDTVEVVSALRDQIEVSDFGLSWDEAMRACLRSKPHIIGIGEMRSKKETVKAVEFALTGHLVLATYHAGNVLKTLERLRQMDVDMLQLAPSLNIIHSQLLVRKLCKNSSCRILDKANSRKFGMVVYRAGKGCEQCDFEGYRGKTAIVESLQFTEEVEDMMISGVHAKDILTEMRKQNKFTPLAVTARKKVADGETSVEEVQYMLGKVFDQFYGVENWKDDEVFKGKRYIFQDFSEDEEFEDEKEFSIEQKMEKLLKYKIMSEKGESGEREQALKTFENYKLKWNISDADITNFHKGAQKTQETKDTKIYL